VLGFVVLVGDLGSRDTSGFSGNQGTKAEGHLVDDFLPLFFGKGVGKLNLLEVGNRKIGNRRGENTDLTESLLEILRDHAEGHRGESSPKFDTWAGLLLGDEESGLGGHGRRRARTELTKAAEEKRNGSKPVALDQVVRLLK
jgi:hypothetical protein